MTRIVNKDQELKNFLTIKNEQPEMTFEVNGKQFVLGQWYEFDLGFQKITGFIGHNASGKPLFSHKEGIVFLETILNMSLIYRRV